MNDVPKLASVFLIGQVLSPTAAIAGVAAAMLIGGVVQSRKIAETMGTKMTEMNPGQALTANLSTAAIVLFSSKLGVPVSTTHVACGSLFGIGASTGGLRTDMLKKILLAWAFTLPVGGLFGCLYFLALRGQV
jgi:PiT family inorganic phosphate transporter